MNKKDEQEYRWNLLIELELYSILEDVEDDLKREALLAKFCEAYEISVPFAKAKIERIKQQKALAAEKETEDYDGR